MNQRLRIAFLISAVLAVVTGALYHFSLPSEEPPSLPVAVSDEDKPDLSVAGKDGILHTVMTPPKLFNGRLSPETDSAEDFSSNPKRDETEKLVLRISAEHGVAKETKVARLLDLIPTLPSHAQV